MFSSKTSRDLNHDPEPWQEDWPSLRRFPKQRGPYLPIGNMGDDLLYHPRPEFDHVQHSAPNPILVAFRSNPHDPVDLLAALGGDGPEFDFDAWEASSDESRADASASEDDNQIDHARRVLTRLAALTTTTEGI